MFWRNNTTSRNYFGTIIVSGLILLGSGCSNSEPQPTQPSANADATETNSAEPWVITSTDASIKVAGKVVAFDGTTVTVQSSSGGNVEVPANTLPDEYVEFVLINGNWSRQPGISVN